MLIEKLNGVVSIKMQFMELRGSVGMHLRGENACNSLPANIRLANHTFIEDISADGSHISGCRVQVNFLYKVGIEIVDGQRSQIVHECMGVRGLGLSHRVYTHRANTHV